MIFYCLEKRYQNWKVSNSLTFNTLNDYDTSNIRDNDVLHFPSMIRPISEKQLIFDGISNKKHIFQMERCIL